jgi:hypothetical protein
MDRHHATVCCGIKRIKDLLDSKDPAIMKLFDSVKDTGRFI